MRKNRKSVRSQTSEAVKGLSKKPMSLSPMSVIGGFSSRIISPKTFDYVDEAGFLIVCFLFFSGMSYVFFSIKQSFFAYFWGILAAIMLFGLFVQLYIFIKDKHHEKSNAPET